MCGPAGSTNKAMSLPCRKTSPMRSTILWLASRARFAKTKNAGRGAGHHQAWKNMITTSGAISTSFAGPGEDVSRARAIWQEGLVKFPDSALLRIKLAATYANDIFNNRSADPAGDAALGWKLLEEARAKPDLSRQEVWLLHWLSAHFLRMHKGDFVAAAAEAEAAI